MKYWHIEDRPRDYNVLHTFFVLLNKRDEHRNLENYNTRFVVCSYKEFDYVENSFSSFELHSARNDIMCSKTSRMDPSPHRNPNRFSSQKVGLPGV